ncbi:MAG TPA: adenylyl cyclase, partial [Rugosimonospora sp.]|nr:adenylyl cyclase [Rugosimonospora sp.]
MAIDTPGSTAPSGGRRSGRRRHARWLVGLAALLLTAGVVNTAGAAAADAHGSPAHGGSGQPDFGPNVKIFDPSMPISDIQAAVDAVYSQQVDNEMGTQRYTLLFKPGTYGTTDHPLIFQVGYYTEVAGLGISPTDVVINGHVDVYNRCLAADNCTALVNFWRSLANLTINVTGTGLDGCRASGDFWAVSQAAPMRRVNITGANLTLQDYCTAGPQYASGGFISDSSTGFVINGSQQQFLVRNSSVGGWSNAVWNQVFAGVQGAPAQSFPSPQYTTLDTTPVSKERPFLYVDGSGRYRVFVPDVQRDSSGTTWQNGPTPGHSIPLSDFYVAKPSDSVQTINSQLARGRNLLLTPGVYNVAQSIEVKKADTIVLGQGFATLTAVHGAVPLRVADVKGVDIAGIMIDAGTVNSPALLEVGTSHGNHGYGKHDTAGDPTVLQDVFFRIGGPHVGKATTTLVVNQDDTILDDIWAWRADHGVTGSVGWTVNTADTGLIVNGDDVTALGLFVEHYQKYNVIWNGEGGRTIFFQNELPYDPPNQAAWQHNGILGWAAYKV